MSLQDEALNNRICTAPNNSKDTIPRSEVVEMIEGKIREIKAFKLSISEGFQHDHIHIELRELKDQIELLTELLTKIKEKK